MRKGKEAHFNLLPKCPNPRTKFLAECGAVLAPAEGFTRPQQQRLTSNQKFKLALPNGKDCEEPNRGSPKKKNKNKRFSPKLLNREAQLHSRPGSKAPYRIMKSINPAKGMNVRPQR
ncbi:hypothetical protein L3X38_025441 [Prunus dulcis]|uniref:Uncharacterized protein n=1 Tax=Prunus dulcis TaxID=3755 RepID=A0AAD4W2U5_PRUDU|nr:hypothetical protein L3X38_025441 [Prunus dulcis]